MNEAIANKTQLRQEYAEAIRKASNDNFREFCNKQGKEDVWSVTNRLLKNSIPTQPPSTLKIAPNKYTTSCEETARIFLQKFYPQDTTDTYSSQTVTRQTTKFPPNTNDDPPFTIDEVLHNLKDMNPRKSPGPDHLTSDICFCFTQTFPELITNIMNRCLALSIFPKQWKHAQVIIIPKPNKLDYTVTSAYRPIGLLNVFGKLLEKLVIKRLNHFMYTNNKCNNKQYGFKEQKSTTEALSNMITFVRNCKIKGDQVAAVSFDIQAAFDNAWWPAILRRLHIIDCPQNI
ncbi:unnamed protein product [Parnassius mnemosyne]|uniref:Reverse transcriptase domain-containing protein n=1 Tax=Parnassius mnemosyne TaxID=213953 RepID=A0AAV1KK55_9NEOP